MQKPPAYIPQALENIMDELKLFINKAGIELTEIINIHYGKNEIQIRCSDKPKLISFMEKRDFRLSYHHAVVPTKN